MSRLRSKSAAADSHELKFYAVFLLFSSWSVYLEYGLCHHQVTFVEIRLGSSSIASA
jgi:hypothetical protein